MFTTRPPHGYSPTLLCELGTAELFVLSSLRLWFLSHCDRDHQYPDWRQAFETANITADRAWGFDRLCRVVGTTTLRSLDVHWLNCGRLGQYEISLLKVIGFLQQDRGGAAEQELLKWCPPTAVRLGLEAAQALAAALLTNSLRIPVGEQVTVRPRSPTIPPSVGSARLH